MCYRVIKRSSGQKKAAGGSDGLDGKDGVKNISDIEGFLEKENK